MQRQVTSDKRHESLQQKRQQAEAILKRLRRVIVAFSGGIDSTLLAKLARDTLGKINAVAVTADSPSLARADLEEARRLARALDLEHLVVQTQEVANPSYRVNTDARCYFCKQELFDELDVLAKAQNFSAVVYGAIGDDQLSERPGQQAALEHGVRAPLQEVGLKKWEIRQLAKTIGLPNWNRPQNACLSSRIPHGREVTGEKLAQIEAAEALLRAQGFLQVRVRHLGTHARIEVGQEEVARFQDVRLCAEVSQRFAALGFDSVGIDRAGYRAGGASHAADEILLTAISRC